AQETALKSNENDHRLRDLPGWALVDGAIRRTYQTDGWRGSMLVANGVALLCEDAAHHADGVVTCPEVTRSLAVPRAGAITEPRFRRAALPFRSSDLRSGSPDHFLTERLQPRPRSRNGGHPPPETGSSRRRPRCRTGSPG